MLANSPGHSHRATSLVNGHGLVITRVTGNRRIRRQPPLLRRRKIDCGLPGQKQDKLPDVVGFWKIDTLPREKGFEILLCTLLGMKGDRFGRSSLSRPEYENGSL